MTTIPLRDVVVTWKQPTPDESPDQWETKTLSGDQLARVLMFVGALYPATAHFAGPDDPEAVFDLRALAHIDAMSTSLEIEGIAEWTRVRSALLEYLAARSYARECASDAGALIDAAVSITASAER
jgi:hypothetical protein